MADMPFNFSFADTPTGVDASSDTPTGNFSFADLFNTATSSVQKQIPGIIDTIVKKKIGTTVQPQSVRRVPAKPAPAADSNGIGTPMLFVGGGIALVALFMAMRGSK